MSGIEFYPQKEFDEDMEDKSDNDKIRVSGSVGSCSLSHPHALLPLNIMSWLWEMLCVCFIP